MFHAQSLQALNQPGFGVKEWLIRMMSITCTSSHTHTSTTIRISGAEQEYSLSKDEVELNRAWSPSWVTIYVLGFAGHLKISPASNCALYEKVLWMRL